MILGPANLQIQIVTISPGTTNVEEQTALDCTNALETININI